MSKEQKPDPKTQSSQTRLNSELGHRYSNAMMPAKKKKPSPGRGSLTEDLEEAVEPEQETEEKQTAEQEVAAVEAEPKKSIFELPRKEPSRPTLLGGGVEVAPSTAAPSASSSSSRPSSGAPATPGRRSPRRG